MTYIANKEAEIFASFDRLAEHKEAKSIFEATPSDDSTAENYSEAQMRSYAMSLILTWLAEGDYSYAAFETVALAIADLDSEDEGELGEEEADELDDILQAAAEALLSMGASDKNVMAFLDEEDDEAGVLLGDFLSSKMDGTPLSDEDIISKYVASGDVILEGTIKVIRGGKLILKKKRVGRARKMNSLQKASLKKARRKAFSGAAKIARKKSMRIRARRGM